MISRVHYRLLFIILLLIFLTPVVIAAWTGAGAADRYENARGEIVSERENITVVTTSPKEDTDASIVAFSPEGKVLYYNETYDAYFDVDPIDDQGTTVEFVAQNIFNRTQCPPTADVCGEMVIEQVNLTTGDIVNRITITGERRYEWHDVDRIGPNQLLVADLNNRIFILNTTTMLITWSYEFRMDWNRSTGGVFPTDWTHLNDVEYLGNGLIMASPRNQDRVVFIDKDRGLQQNMTLGREDDHQILFEQHNPDYIPDGQGGPAILVADSENNRVIEYQRKKGAWKQTWGWSDRQMAWPRDADRLPNGHTLITDSNGERVIEINESGKIVWEVRIDTPYEAERLGTGDESEGGQSAKALNLTGIKPASKTLNSADRTLFQKWLWPVFSFIMEALPSPLVNGILFALPPWIGALELTSTMISGLVGLVWIGSELRWKGYRIQCPITTT